MRTWLQLVKGSLMPEASDNITVGAEPTAVPSPSTVPEQRMSTIFWTVALIVLVAAVVLALIPQACSLGEGQWLTEKPIPGALAFLDDLERQPIDSLPRDVFGYETLALQEVPNTPQAAEALYASWNMQIASHTPVRTYARVEAFPSSSAASARLSELMEQYPSSRRTLLLGGVTPAEAGFTPSTDAGISAWTRGQFVVSVRAFFDSPVPHNAEAILEDVGLYVAMAVEHFQRTGEQGVAARETLQEITDVPEIDEGIGPPPELDAQ